MKNIKNLAVIAATALLFSCENAIDIEQDGILKTENAVLNVDHVESNLLGVYSLLDNSTEIQLNGTYTDELGIGVTSGGQLYDELGLILTSASRGPRAIWRKNYRAIGQVNRFIDLAEKVTPNPDAPEIPNQPSEITRYKNALAEAYAMRAYLYLGLQTYFSEDLTDNSAMGVVIYDTTVGNDDFRARSTNADVWAFIESDLQKATENFVMDKGEFFFRLNTVKAIKARMYAYREMWSQAEQNASELLDSYPISDRATYSEMFKDKLTGEIIFSLDRVLNGPYDQQATSGGGRLVTLYSFGGADANGGLFLEAGRALFNKLDPADIRFDVNIHSSYQANPNYELVSDYKSTDILPVGKYSSNVIDNKIFRASEMLFIKAEAKAAEGNYSEVSELLKQLKDARMGDNTPALSITSEEEAFGAILDERRIELAFEGHRWVDLKRLGEKGNRSIDKDPRDCELTGGCGDDVSTNDLLFTYPIPLTAMDINDLLIQNTGY